MPDDKIITPYLQIETGVWEMVKAEAKKPGHQRPPSAEAGIIIKKYFETTKKDGE